MRVLLKKWREKAELEDLEDRKVHLVNFTFETTTGEQVEYARWMRVDKYIKKLDRVNEMELSDKTLTIFGRTYNTRYIIHLDSEIVDESYIKKSVKKKLGGYKWTSLSAWNFKDYFTENDIEEG